jgi:hypothetical protein
MESEKAAERIARLFPGAKIIFLLRNPVERAVSHYWYSVKNGLEKGSIEEAFLNENERSVGYDRAQVSMPPFIYLKRGRYIDSISTYENYFPIESMRVVLYEQLVGSESSLRDLYAYLGVSSHFKPSCLDQIINKGDRPGDTISPDLKKFLEEYFAESNSRLAKRFGLNLKVWEKTGVP